MYKESKYDSVFHILIYFNDTDMYGKQFGS